MVGCRMATAFSSCVRLLPPAGGTFSGTEQVADFIHARHQRLVDDIDGAWIAVQSFGKVFFQVSIDTLNQCMNQSFVHR